MADHVQCDPATLNENQLRQYFLFPRQDKKLGRSAMTIAKAALRGFFREQLKVQGWTVQLGFLGVLQTWARDLRFHPHIHYLVPGGGLSHDQLRWRQVPNPEFLLPQ